MKRENVVAAAKIDLETETSKDFVKKFPNLFTEDKWFWEQEISKLLSDYREKLKRR